MQANETNRIYTFLLHSNNLEEGKNVQKTEKVAYVENTKQEI